MTYALLFVLLSAFLIYRSEAKKQRVGKNIGAYLRDAERRRTGEFVARVRRADRRGEGRGAA